MKPKIIQYRFGRARYLAIIKNGFVVDIACASEDPLMYFEKDQIGKEFTKPCTEVRAKDLALYTHWPVHTKEFWELLNET